MNNKYENEPIQTSTQSDRATACCSPLTYENVWIPIDDNGDPWMGMLTNKKEPTYAIDGYTWRKFNLKEIF